jgi:hypothetical protein
MLLPQEDPTIKCQRCDRMVLEVHPIGWMVALAFTPAFDEPHQITLCADCLIDLGEFLNPDLKEQGGWISESDQLRAAINENLKRRRG